MDYVKAGLITGAIGDISLQIITKKFNDPWGFKSYFETHGPVGSVFIASGMMGLGCLMSVIIDPSLYAPGLIISGAILDILFRCKRIMPSLDGYYSTLSPVYTIPWGIIPFFIAKYLMIKL